MLTGGLVRDGATILAAASIALISTGAGFASDLPQPCPYPPQAVPYWAPARPYFVPAKPVPPRPAPARPQPPKAKQLARSAPPVPQPQPPPPIPVATPAIVTIALAPPQVPTIAASTSDGPVWMWPLAGAALGVTVTLLVVSLLTAGTRSRPSTEAVFTTARAQGRQPTPEELENLVEAATAGRSEEEIDGFVHENEKYAARLRRAADELGGDDPPRDEEERIEGHA